MKKFVKYPVICNSSPDKDIVAKCKKYIEDEIQYHNEVDGDCVDDGDFFGYPVDDVAYTFSKSGMVRHMVKAFREGATDLDDAWDEACDTGMKMLTSTREIAKMYTSHGYNTPDWLFN